jgi:membrane protease YdiL (CAAX protease family)
MAIEILVVLFLWPGFNIASSFLGLAIGLNGQTTPRLSNSLAGNPTLSTLLNSFVLLVERLGPVAVVAYLMWRSGDLAKIGLDRTRIGVDIALAVGIFALTYAVFHTIRIPGISVPAANGAVPPVFLLLIVVHAVTAGVLEEFVLIGYLATRLQQRGWSPLTIVVATVTLRGLYHSYYGFSAITVMVAGVIPILFYLTTRRLAPAIAGHALYDLVAYLQTVKFA